MRPTDCHFDIIGVWIRQKMHTFDELVGEIYHSLLFESLDHSIVDVFAVY